MNPVIEELKNMSTKDVRYKIGVAYLTDNIDTFSKEEQKEILLLAERLIKGDEEIEKGEQR